MDTDARAAALADELGALAAADGWRLAAWRRSLSGHFEYRFATGDGRWWGLLFSSSIVRGRRASAVAASEYREAVTAWRRSRN